MKEMMIKYNTKKKRTEKLKGDANRQKRLTESRIRSQIRKLVSNSKINLH